MNIAFRKKCQKCARKSNRQTIVNAYATRKKKINKQWRELCMKNISECLRFQILLIQCYFTFICSFCSNFFLPLISAFVAVGTFLHHSSVFKFPFLLFLFWLPMYLFIEFKCSVCACSAIQWPIPNKSSFQCICCLRVFFPLNSLNGLPYV